MTSAPMREIAATMIVTFAVSFAVVWSQRAPRDAAANVEPTPAKDWQHPGPAPRPQPAVPDPALPAPTRPLPSKASLPPDASLSDDAGPPLPVVLSVSIQRGPPPGEDADAATPAGGPGIARQVDLINDSSQPLDITVLVVDVPTQQSTRAALFVPAHTQAHVGTESGLKIEPGNLVTLQSRGFRALTQTVP